MTYNLDDFKPITDTSCKSELNPFRISIAPSGSVGWSYSNITGFRAEMVKATNKSVNVKGFETLYNETANLLMIRLTNTSSKLGMGSVGNKIKRTVLPNVKYPDITELEKDETFEGWYVFGELDVENNAIVYDLNKPVARIKKKAEGK